MTATRFLSRHFAALLLPRRLKTTSHRFSSPLGLFIEHASGQKELYVGDLRDSRKKKTDIKCLLY